MKIRLIVTLLFLCLGWRNSFAQRKVTVAAYNVENLFDLHDDTLKDDGDFLPEGSYQWTAGRYWKKLNNVAQVLTAVGGESGLPALVGLCEIENDTVMHDLTCRSALRTACYEYVMTDSPDQRGVDVALMYQPFLFQLIDWHSVRVPSVEHGFKPTRDLLYAKGQFVSGDTLHVVVCHFPSKAGGGLPAEQHRQLAARTLRSVVDSILTIDTVAKLLVMGDFNAASTERIFEEFLPPLHETLPTSRRALRKAVGTYYFQKQWSYLDHILVSDGFLRWQDGLAAQHPTAGGGVLDAHEARLPFLLNKKGTPNRTYLGSFYNGGVSDHLPLCLSFPLQ